MGETCVGHPGAIQHQSLNSLGVLKVTQGRVRDSTSTENKVFQIRQVRDMLKESPGKLRVVWKVDPHQAGQVPQMDQRAIRDLGPAQIQMSQLLEPPQMFQ